MSHSERLMKIKFLGAARQVTGSCYLLDAGELKILVDCGLFQERDYSYRNWEAFPFLPNRIDYLLLTHVHLDHSGLIPKLVKEGFARDVLLTPASKALFPIVILDSARMQEEDAAYKKKRHIEEDRKGPHPEIPLYTVKDAEKCFPLLKQVPYEELLSLNDHVRVRFHDAGHILGSAIIEIIVQDENGSQSIIFSGDIGQWDKPLLSNPSVFDRADYVVMESTYGDRNHENLQDIDDKLSRVVNDTVNACGNLLIPTFAIERAQDLLFHFGRLARAKKIPYVVTFLDSPMAVEITKVFEQFEEYFERWTSNLIGENGSPFNFPGLKLAEFVEASKAINLIKGSVIIMAGSGRTAQLNTEPARLNQEITNFLLNQRKEGRANETIRARIQSLKQVARTTDILNPEKVKEYLANYPKWNNGTKAKFVDTYTAFLKFLGRTWNPPTYLVTQTLPFIPTEQEIDLLISGTGKVTSTILQTLKETGMRIGELVLLTWKDLDTERKLLSITPVKGSNPRILPISEKLINMINRLPKNRPTIFQPRKNSLRDYFDTQRKKLALKLNNPRLLNIHFHTLRHWKGTMEYHKIQDIMRVKTILGHKNIESTIIYINLEQALFLNQTDDWTCKTAKDLNEASKLIETGFEYITEIDGIKLFRKRK